MIWGCSIGDQTTDHRKEKVGIFNYSDQTVCLLLSLSTVVVVVDSGDAEKRLMGKKSDQIYLSKISQFVKLIGEFLSLSSVPSTAEPPDSTATGHNSQGSHRWWWCFKERCQVDESPANNQFGRVKCE